MGSLAREIRQLLEENDVCEESEELDIDEIVGWAMEDDDCEEMDEGCGSKHKSDDDDDDDEDDDEMDEDVHDDDLDEAFAYQAMKKKMAPSRDDELKRDSKAKKAERSKKIKALAKKSKLGPGKKMVFGRVVNVGEDINILEGMSAEARELQIFIQNDGQLYRQQHLPIIKNAMTKHGQGKYDSMKAVKLFMYLVDNGAKKYAKEAGPGAKWNEMFPKSVRLQVAAALRDDFEDEARLGNYDEYIPKKYQKKVSGKTIGEDVDGGSEELQEAADPTKKIDAFVSEAEQAIAQIRHSMNVWMKDPEKYAPQLKNVSDMFRVLMRIGQIGMRRVEKMQK
jgi:hypothetical protein